MIAMLFSKHALTIGPFQVTYSRFNSNALLKMIIMQDSVIVGQNWQSTPPHHGMDSM